MARILLTGATGRLGTAVRSRLADTGHEVRAASRDPSAEGEGEERPPAGDGIEWVELDLAEGTGVESAVADVDVVVHCASAPQGDTEAVDVKGTERLADAAAAAGVSNFVYPSIVGIEEIPYSYYECKLAAEGAIEASDVPATIIRATQFHEFVDDLLGAVARLPVWPLPTKFRIQPVAVAEVADEIVGLATPDASGRVDPFCGPEVLTVRDVAVAYRESRGLRRPVVRLPLPGATASAFREGHATRPGRSDGSVTWAEWLAERSGPEATPGREPAHA